MLERFPLRTGLLTVVLTAFGCPAEADVYMFMGGPSAGTQLYSGPGSFFINPAMNGSTDSAGYIYWSEKCGIWFVGDFFGAPAKESEKYGHGLVFKITKSDTVASEVSDVTMKALAAVNTIGECGQSTALSCLIDAAAITNGLSKTIGAQVGIGNLTQKQAKALGKKVGKVGVEIQSALDGLVDLNNKASVQHPVDRAKLHIAVRTSIVKAMSLNRKVVSAMKSMKLIEILHPGE